MIQVLQKAATLLAMVAQEGPVSFTAIQQRSGLHKATLSNILKTLQALDFVARDEAGQYTIGGEIVDLARPAMHRDALAAAAEEAAGSLAEEIRETVVVGILRDGERYNLARAHANQSLSVDARLEQRPSPYNTATGRVLLAHLDDDALADIFARKGCPGKAWPGMETLEKLRRACAEIREAGMASHVSRDGQAESLAVPARDPEGTVIAAIGAAVPAYRLSGTRRDEVLDALRRASMRLEHAYALRVDRAATMVEA